MPVKLKDDDQKWVRNIVQDSESRILGAIPGFIAEAINQLKPRGWRRAVRLLRELGPIATIIGVVIALLGITLGSCYQAFSHIAEETRFRTHTEDRLTDIEKSLARLLTSIESQKPDFKKALPSLLEQNAKRGIETKNAVSVATSRDKRIINCTFQLNRVRRKFNEAVLSSQGSVTIKTS